MKIGYARVSTIEQSLEGQTDQLEAYGCELIISEKFSGKSKERKGIAELFSKLRKNDTVVVVKLDRMGRSLKDLLEIVFEIHKVGANFVSIKDSIDTLNPSGKFFFHVIGALAEFERDLISERTKAGLEAAKSRGRTGGRKKGLSSKAIKKAKMCYALSEQSKSTTEISEIMDMNRTTAWRYVRYIRENRETIS